jgi:hypothetical protein
LSALAVLLALAAAPAYASEVRCDLIAIQGSSDGKGIDREVAHIKELSDSRFSAYSRFAFLGRAKKGLDKGKEQSLVLTKKLAAKLTYEGEKGGGDLKFKVSLPSLGWNFDADMASGNHFINVEYSGLIVYLECEKKAAK